LVIDDSDVDRLAMTELLSAAGFDAQGLPSPIGATRMARQVQARVVVIDQNLPAMDGSKLAALFRGNAALRDIRLVLVSSSDATVMVEVARLARADAFVSKQTMHTELVATVRRLAAS
jgi:chemosensory pili system protein ChpA (sensor histidine kinase/response regulator)